MKGMLNNKFESPYDIFFLKLFIQKNFDVKTIVPLPMYQWTSSFKALEQDFAAFISLFCVDFFLFFPIEKIIDPALLSHL